MFQKINTYDADHVREILNHQNRLNRQKNTF